MLHILVIKTKRKKKETKPNTCKDVLKATGIHTFLVGLKSGTVNLGNKRVSVSYKIKHPLKIRPSNPTPIYFPKTNKNLCSHKTCI